MAEWWKEMRKLTTVADYTVGSANAVITINVKNIDDAMSKIKKSGGKIIMDKFKVGDMGISAYFQDTENNILGLWQNLK